jgi:hypothetical protein
MSETVNRAIRKSSEDFLSLVWPEIGKAFGEIIPVETVTDNDFAKQLDTRAGIDNWLIGVDGHMRGLASRVQWTDKSYDTFTIRVRTRYGYATEYHKRKKEIATLGTITPYYVTQAYVSKDRTRLVAAAIGRMRDVICAVDDEVGRLMPPNSDGSQGWAVPWQSLMDRGAPLQVWPPTMQEELPLEVAPTLADCDWPPVAPLGGA